MTRPAAPLQMKSIPASQASTMPGGGTPWQRDGPLQSSAASSRWSSPPPRDPLRGVQDEPLHPLAVGAAGRIAGHLDEPPELLLLDGFILVGADDLRERRKCSACRAVSFRSLWTGAQAFTPISRGQRPRAGRLLHMSAPYAEVLAPPPARAPPHRPETYDPDGHSATQMRRACTSLHRYEIEPWQTSRCSAFILTKRPPASAKGTVPGVCRPGYLVNLIFNVLFFISKKNLYSVG